MSIAITSAPDSGGGVDGREVGVAEGLGCGEVAVVGGGGGKTWGVGVALLVRLSIGTPRPINNQYPRVALDKANNKKASAGFQLGRCSGLKIHWRSEEHTSELQSLRHL